MEIFNRLSVSIVNHTVSFDFHQPFRSYKGSHRQQCTGRPDVAEELAMGLRHSLPITDIFEKDAGVSDLIDSPAHLLYRSSDNLQTEAGV
jgi:hypothetical protein